MNKVILIGRLVKNPTFYPAENNKGSAVAKYTLAISRSSKQDNGENDFIPCTSFGKMAEAAQKFLYQGMRVAISGRIQTGSYKKKDGSMVYTTEVIVEEQNFIESKPKDSNM